MIYQKIDKRSGLKRSVVPEPAFYYLSFGNFSDKIMEGKQGKFNFSGGKTGPTEKREYQECVLEQQFVNAWFRADKKTD